MAVASPQQRSPMCVFMRIVCQKILNYINKLIAILEATREVAGKCCASASLGTSVAAIVPFFERIWSRRRRSDACALPAGHASHEPRGSRPGAPRSEPIEGGGIIDHDFATHAFVGHPVTEGIHEICVIGVDEVLVGVR